jgi:nondiscriminating glutamyl-tRNA synthetase
VLRSSGLPTYNFACVVDDAGMRISHVIRAEEHLANTPRQLMLYDALGWTPPGFAHVPLILNRDRTKMSKRSGEAAVAVGDYRRAGFVAEALLSYLALLGFHPGDDREILSRAELLEAFTLERVGKSGSVFDPDKLAWVNAHVLHHASGADLLRWGGEFLPAGARGLPAAEQVRLLEAVRGNLATLADLPGELAPMLGEAAAPDEEARIVLEAPRSREICAALADNLERLAEWSGEAVKSAVLAEGRRLGIKGRELYQPVRAALTGRVHGPELPIVAETLGRERCIARLRAASR